APESIRPIIHDKDVVPLVHLRDRHVVAAQQELRHHRQLPGPSDVVFARHRRPSRWHALYLRGRAVTTCYTGRRPGPVPRPPAAAPTPPPRSCRSRAPPPAPPPGGPA